MEFLLDTINIKDITYFNERLPIAGVTSNPSIVKVNQVKNFYEHMNEIRQIIGPDKSLHVQVVADTYDGMMKDAHSILEKIDSKVFIKVPTTIEGLKVIKALKQEGVNITATAVYTKMQAYLAMAAQADYIAPYYNRMENLNIDPKEAILAMATEIDKNNYRSKILAASFKNVNQVNESIKQGAHAVTVSSDIFVQAFNMPSIDKATHDFKKDWESIYGENINIHNL
ncbi:fructose-6-phosphate aldolase [Atopobacter phocae]|uniref:fructose-6-phosphate aldolase n=1 Tax=Atopobacter phocae TaxID=136492 RepID=UPI00047147F0|nr:fructose-6-phosphate aldolase [Atopobacter phocae]